MKRSQAWMRIFALAAAITFFIWMVAQVREGFEVGSCAKFTTCGDCTEVSGCVWCPNAQKCSAEDRTGFPKDSACDKSRFVAFSDKCGVASESNDSIFKAPPVEQPGPTESCPSTTKAVEDVMKVLDPTIKEGVKKEMAKYGIAIKEGFQAQSPMANMAVAEIRDNIREIVRRSVAAAPVPVVGPAPAPGPAVA